MLQAAVTDQDEFVASMCQSLAGGGLAPLFLPRRGSDGRPAKPAIGVDHAAMASVANINDVLEGHVALEVQCVDRLYLNANLPRMPVGGQVVRFLRGHLGYEIPSPASPRFTAPTYSIYVHSSMPSRRARASFISQRSATPELRHPR
jgi:hypothetical protein